METNWDEISRTLLPAPGPRLLPTQASTLAFDSFQELLWVGNEYGRATSFYGSKLQKYTSFKGHPASEGAVQQFLFNERGVLSLASKNVHFSLRRGLAQWNIRHENMNDLCCMSYTSRGTSEILAAGTNGTMFTIDVDRGQIIKEIPTTEKYTLMRRSRYICAATTTGNIDFIDPTSLKVIKSWKAHAAAISDMDAQNNFLVTCGYSPRPQQNYMLDPLANVFDIRMLQPLPPIPFHAGAAFVRMHPKMSTTSIVASQNGQMQVVDLMNPNTVNLRQANVSSFLTALEIAPSGNALAVADADCSVHLWGSPDKVRFADVPSPTEWADGAGQEQQVDWTAETPLSSIGMPHYRELLLSSWPSHLLHQVRRQPVKPDAQVVASITPQEFGAYAPNPRKGRRYQLQDLRDPSAATAPMAVPKFLSEKAREPTARRPEETPEPDAESSTSSQSANYQVPPSYKSIEIKYSRFGVDDFDFEFYNKTKFSGLETHISNSYCNPLLQLFRFTTVLKNLALHHTALNCVSEVCLLCEMGFLFDMLQKADGQNCQATNFLRTLSESIFLIPSAQAMHLLEEDSGQKPLAAMIQSMNRFLLERISLDFKSTKSNVLDLTDALGTLAMTTWRCVKCNTETGKNEPNFVHNLNYSFKTHYSTKSSSYRNVKLSFSQLLKNSVERDAPVKGWCPSCRRYLTMSVRRHIQKIPRILMLNAAVENREARQVWSSPNWLPDQIGLELDRGQFMCYEGADIDKGIKAGRPMLRFNLVGLVMDVKDPDYQTSHLVSMINTQSSLLQPTTTPGWYLFNDFLVKAVSKQEALDFSATWKTPCILTYQVVDITSTEDDSWKQNLDTSLLYSNEGEHTATTKGLSRVEDQVTNGTPIAIDAEFVLLHQEEIDIKADGSRETVRPSRLGLARVSVLRGNGIDEGVPFIDDYIVTTEPVIDYLTAFSGIRPGDLERGRSTHNLVPLKVAYKKLWLLLNLGCVFVGHGLPKDFRTINMHVPRDQVIDTVDLFFIKSRQRKLSLRFLAWYLLKEDIQTETHDSIEDARTALKLHRKYEEFEDAGILEMMLNDIYARGREVNFKAPGTQVPNIPA